MHVMSHNWSAKGCEKTSWWRKSSNMTVGQSSLISLTTIATTDIQEATGDGLATS